MARIKYKGVIRKKIYLVKILGNDPFKKGDEIVFENKKIGNILSCIKEDNKILALALLKNAMIDEDPNISLKLGSNVIII